MPSVQANQGASATARSSTMCTPAACGSTALRMVVAPAVTPVSDWRISPEAKDTRGMPRAAQKSRVTKGLYEGMA